MKERARLLFISLCCASIRVACAESGPDLPTGSWAGSYQPPPMEMPIVVNFTRKGTDLTAETQSPNQSQIFNPADFVSFDKNHVAVVFSRFNTLFNADLSGNTLSGTVTQQGNTNGLFLVHSMPDATSCKPADPLTGQWRGTIALKQAPVLLVLSVAGAGANLGATIQTPSTNPTAFPVDTITYNAGTLTFHHGMFGADFTGKISGITLTGTLTLNGYSIPLVLQRRLP